MKKMIKKLKLNNNGSAIVVVIIALAFVGVLAATAMWMSMSNYRMKATDKSIKGNFYTAETVFEQIVAGLQGESSDAAATAYRRVMQNYVSASGDPERYSRFVKFYKEELINNLHDASVVGTAKYDKDRIAKYLDPALQTRLGVDAAHSTPADGNKFTMTGEMEKSSDDYDFITLKGFRLEFTDDKGYYSVIETDIMMTAPKVSFTMSSPMPEVFKYAIIADTGIKKNIANVDINGNIYAGEEGIDLGSGKLNIDNADYVISMGKVYLNSTNTELNIDHSDSSVNTQFWAKDIDITSENPRNMSGGKINVNADTYVEDDLTLDAPAVETSFKGKYIGYGNSTTEADKSSALMINSLNSKVDMSGLDEFTLAGSSFISLSSYYKDTDVRRLYDLLISGEKKVDDITMGDSIAIKSDQIALLVPEECIWIKSDAPSEKIETEFSQNPVVYSDSAYTALLNKYCSGDASKVSAGGTSGQTGKALYQVMFDKYLDKPDKDGNKVTLSRYVNSTDDIIRVYSNKGGGRNDILLYYYMKLSPEKASEFIRDYYDSNEEVVKEYYDVYVQGDNLALPGSNINMAGPFLASTIGGVPVSGNKLNGKTIVTAEDEQKLIDSITSYKAIISSLTERLMEGGYVNNTIDTPSPESHVFQNVIDEAAVNTFLGAASGVTERFVLDDGYYALVTNDDIEFPGGYDGSKCRLIISTKDVTVKGDFTGVMFVNGTVTIDSDCTISGIEKSTIPDARSQLVRVLQCRFGATETARDKTKPLDLFIDGSNYVLAGTQITPRDESATESDKVDVLDTVNYKNWIKK